MHSQLYGADRENFLRSIDFELGYAWPSKNGEQSRPKTVQVLASRIKFNVATVASLFEVADSLAPAWLLRLVERFVIVPTRCLLLRSLRP